MFMLVLAIIPLAAIIAGLLLADGLQRISLHDSKPLVKYRERSKANLRATVSRREVEHLTHH